MAKIQFRTPYDPSDDFPGLKCLEPSLAVQADKDETDINVLMERFKVTGNLPVSPIPPSFGDFSAVGDYRSALHAIMQARDAFMQLPAEVRARFRHDPGAFVEFASDPANLDQMQKWGLAPISAKPVSGGIGGNAPDAKPADAPKS